MDCSRQTYAAVLEALRLGHRHIDTAQWFRNEADVGRAVQDSGVPRDDVFITTKLWVSEWGYAKATAAVHQSATRMAVSHIDLLLLHAPGDAVTRADTRRALEDLQTQGVVRDIGASNFGEAHLEKLFETARVKPAVNQIELRPWLARAALVAFCRRHDVLVEAYSLLAKATCLDDRTLVGIARATRATPTQVLLAYSHARGYGAIPKAPREPGRASFGALGGAARCVGRAGRAPRGRVGPDRAPRCVTCHTSQLLPWRQAPHRGDDHEIVPTCAVPPMPLTKAACLCCGGPPPVGGDVIQVPS